MTTTRGLEGVVAAESKISSIIDDKLTYVGYDIDDLTEHASFEEVVYLLWHKRLPNKYELEDFRLELMKNAALPEEVVDHIRSVPKDHVHPMAVLRTAVSFLSLLDDEADLMDEDSNYQKALRIQAKIGTIVTAYARIRKGLEPVEPRTDLSYAANFLYMLKGKEPEAIEEEAFNKALVLHADHEFNASTFASRVCVATLSDIYSGITTAIGTLKGPLHGGANEQVMRMLDEIGSFDNVEPYIYEKFAKKEKIMGFGHRVYRKGDPRAKHLKVMSEKLTRLVGKPELYEMSVKIEEIVTKEKNIPANVDFYSATVYHSLGIDTDLFTPIFAVSRTSGWLAHILEQYANNRLIRPRAEYVGPGKREYVKLENR